MEIHGKQWIAGKTMDPDGSVGSFRAIQASSGQSLAPDFYEATDHQIDQALRLANGAFDGFRALSPDRRADLLERIGDEIMSLGDALLERAHAETGLPLARLTGERGRAVGQAKLFAKVIREGSWVDARIDLAQPDRQPLAKPDIRRCLIPIGPVVVFGASNFPLAISVVGSDTVSALGVGCPVVVKGHPAHPGTCEMLALAVYAALDHCGIGRDVFSLIQGRSQEVGSALVTHPVTRAVAFTGSLRGGRALYNLAAGRPEPIPVYAEMGSTNPVFVLPGALRERGEAIAQGYLQSVTLGVGQFCTNPGLVVGLGNDDWQRFLESVKKQGETSPLGTMLHPGISKAFRAGVEQMEGLPGVQVLTRSKATAGSQAPCDVGCVVFLTSMETYLANPALKEENFGPSSVIIEAEDSQQLETMAEGLEGHLTATVHGTPEDLKQNHRLLRILERKVGRLIVNGFPTGIEVCSAMHHGGNYPATTHGFFTSIGTASLQRFVRPLCYQNVPQEELPEPLRDKNVRKIWRMVENEWSQGDVG